MSFDLDHLAERIDALEDALEAEREQRRELEEELAEKEERIDELEQLVDVREPEEGDVPGLSDVWIGGQPVGRVAERANEGVKELEERLESDEPDAAEELEATAPPIYDLIRTPPDRLKPTERRTRFLWADLPDYAERGPGGYCISASDARRVLTAAEPEDSGAARIDAKHVGRVFELSVVLTREAAFIRKKNGERQLVVPTDWEDRARAAADDAAVT